MHIVGLFNLGDAAHAIRYTEIASKRTVTPHDSLSKLCMESGSLWYYKYKKVGGQKYIHDRLRNKTLYGLRIYTAKNDTPCQMPC